MLEAGPISLLMLSGVAVYERKFMFMREMLQQPFTSTRPVSPDAYKQDLDEFLDTFKERQAWIKRLAFKPIPGMLFSAATIDYISVPCDANSPSQFCIISAFSDPADATAYRKHFYP